MEAEKDRRAHAQSGCVVRHGLAALVKNRLRLAAYAWPYSTPDGADKRSDPSNASSGGDDLGGAPSATSACTSATRSATTSSTVVLASIVVLVVFAATAR
jgi:hypothetical protein